MRTIKYILAALCAAVLLTACEHTISTETTVHPDGSLDKVFVFENKDSVKNMVGLSDKGDWSKSVEIKPGRNKEDKKFISSFRRHFASADAANQVLAAPDDSLLRISSHFEKSFRWFYTYIRYSETIHTLNNLRLGSEDFLVREDFEFIDRLPAEGKPISKADAYFLEELNKRIYDGYGARAFFQEYLTIGEQSMTDQGLEKRWFDTLRAHQEDIFRKLQGEKDMNDYYLLHAMDSIGIPLKTTTADTGFRQRYKILESKLNFISEASEGKYHHRINMPWNVVTTNADSVAGNSLFWSPPSIKFLLKDYTMSGECRDPNYGVWALSAAIIAFTAFLLLRGQISKSPHR